MYLKSCQPQQKTCQPVQGRPSVCAPSTGATAVPLYHAMPLPCLLSRHASRDLPPSILHSSFCTLHSALFLSAANSGFGLLAAGLHTTHCCTYILSTTSFNTLRLSPGTPGSAQGTLHTLSSSA